MRKPVTAIFDIGKTNKKFFLFDRELNEIHHAYEKLPLIKDEDGFECDDLTNLAAWIKKTIHDLVASPEYDLECINFSTYGATLVHLGKDGKPVTPLYNYLKPFPQKTLDRFTSAYGKESNDLETASPCLGMLNSGLQLYWLKYDKPEVFKKITHTLHFPQYLSYLFTGKQVSEPTSIGSHTKLWDFSTNNYHRWLKEENLDGLFPPVVAATQFYPAQVDGHTVRVGVGIHDSSSALTSYMVRAGEPFILVSTGTWSITLNPFTTEPLTAGELKRDCLNYLTVHGKPVKASRLFLGNELDYQLQMLCDRFNKEHKYYKQIKADPEFLQQVKDKTIQPLFYPGRIDNPVLIHDLFPSSSPVDVAQFATFEEGYHHAMWGLVQLQAASIRLALGTSGIKKIYIDGGFIENDLYIKLLQLYFPGYDIEVSHMPLGSAYGAAVVMRGDVGDVNTSVGKSAKAFIL